MPGTSRRLGRCRIASSDKHPANAASRDRGLDSSPIGPPSPVTAPLLKFTPNLPAFDVTVRDSSHPLGCGWQAVDHGRPEVLITIIATNRSLCSRHGRVPPMIVATRGSGAGGYFGSAGCIPSFSGRVSKMFLLRSHWRRRGSASFVSIDLPGLLVELKQLFGGPPGHRLVAIEHMPVFKRGARRIDGR
jgi:hypothetical protein